MTCPRSHSQEKRQSKDQNEGLITPGKTSSLLSLSPSTQNHPASWPRTSGAMASQKVCRPTACMLTVLGLWLLSQTRAEERTGREKEISQLRRPQSFIAAKSSFQIRKPPPCFHPKVTLNSQQSHDQIAKEKINLEVDLKKIHGILIAGFHSRR